MCIFCCAYEAWRCSSCRRCSSIHMRMSVVGPMPCSCAYSLIFLAVSGSKRTLKPSDKFFAKRTCTGLNSSSNSVVSCVSQNSASSSMLVNSGIRLLRGSLCSLIVSLLSVQSNTAAQFSTGDVEQADHCALGLVPGLDGLGYWQQLHLA